MTDTIATPTPAPEATTSPETGAAAPHTPIICPPGYLPGWLGTDGQPTGCTDNHPDPINFPTPTPTPTAPPTATAAPTPAPAPAATSAPSAPPLPAASSAPAATHATTTTAVVTTPAGLQLADTGANISGVGLIVVGALILAGVAALAADAWRNRRRRSRS